MGCKVKDQFSDNTLQRIFFDIQEHENLHAVKHHTIVDVMCQWDDEKFSFSVSQQREQLSSSISRTVKQLLSDKQAAALLWIRKDRRRVITMRTSSQRLAAVRKSEAMLLASVNCSNLCLNLGSYLPTDRDTSHFVFYVPTVQLPDGSVPPWTKERNSYHLSTASLHLISISPSRHEMWRVYETMWWICAEHEEVNTTELSLYTLWGKIFEMNKNFKNNV